MRAIAAVICGLMWLFVPFAVAQNEYSAGWRDAEDRRPALKNWPVAFESAVQVLRPELTAVPSAASHFVAVVPCRVLDTRNSGSPIPTNSTRTVDVPGSACGIPSGAAAYSMNFTVMNPLDNGYLTAYPAGSTRPATATLGYLAGGPAFDNSAVVPAGTLGAIDVYVAAELHLIIDINGYFAEGVVTSLAAGTGMSGGGTGSVTLGIANGGVDTAQLATNAVTDAKLATITAAGKVANSATTATSANTANTIVARDGAGGFAAGAVTLTGLLDQTSVDGLVAKGTFGAGAIPATGAGARLMWYPRKAAFRAGQAEGAEWDDASIGSFSAAIGRLTIASGNYSTAMGHGATASGAYSTAIGYGTTASGNYYSTAIGSETTASANNSTAIGRRTTASGASSTAMGNNTAASGASSTAMGYTTAAIGSYSTAMGYATVASGIYSTAMGYYASTSDAGGSARDGTFVWGDASTTTTVRPTAAHQFVARAAGGVTFYSNSAMSTGVFLAAGGGSWASVSDRERKQDFRPVEGEDILRKLAVLPVTSWRYRDDASARRYIGPVAQDFHGVFGLGTDTTIATLDVDGVTLAAIKALEARTAKIETLEARTAALQAENARLSEKIERLMQSIEHMNRNNRE